MAAVKKKKNHKWIQIAIRTFVALSFLLGGIVLAQGLDTGLWKLALVTIELGHYVGLIGLILLATSLLYEEWGAPQGMAFVCVVLYFVPMGQVLRSQGAWRQELKTAFGNSEVLDEPLMSVRRLFVDFAPHQEPERYVFSAPALAAISKDKPLSLLFYRAKNVNAPFVVVIHGGGWDSGDAGQLPELNSRLARDGISVASIEYRLAPKHRWPAQRDDAEAAIAFLKKNAVALGLDPTRYAVLGRSAGGHIAEAVAYRRKDPALKGCISFYAPSDLDFGYVVAEPHDLLESRGLIRALLGNAPENGIAVYRDASPLNDVSRTSPPTLLFHGHPDPLAWYKHSERLHRALNANGVKNVFILFGSATHGFDYTLRGPHGQVSTNAIRHLLKRVF